MFENIHEMALFHQSAINNKSDKCLSIGTCGMFLKIPEFVVTIIIIHYQKQLYVTTLLLYREIRWALSVPILKVEFS